MDPSFWHERWQTRQIGFHLTDVNPRLVEHRAVLDGCRRVFVPLCGKTVDLGYLASEGHEVVGVELSEQAARAWFEEAGRTPERTETPEGVVLREGAVTIVAGDVFATTVDSLGGRFDAIYDRAATIALPDSMRGRYVDHLRGLLAPGAPVLLVTLEYDAAGGPPFSVPTETVRALYAGATVTELARVDALPRTPNAAARGASRCDEVVYRIDGAARA